LAKSPSAGFPIAIERAMVCGTTGSTAPASSRTRRTIGAHPAALAPKIRGAVPATSPAVVNSWNPLRSFVTSEPPAIGATTAVGSRHPSCSAISNAASSTLHRSSRAG